MTGAAPPAVPALDARPSPRSARKGWRPALIAIAFGIPAMLIAHATTVAETVSTWDGTQSYRFAWAVLPTLAYLLWHDRKRLARLTPSASALGIVAAALCAVLWVASDLMNIAEGRQLALVAGLCAVVLAAAGRSVFRALAPYLCLLAFLIPTGRFLLAPLKRIAVDAAQAFAAVVGMPFSTDGYSMLVGTHRYVVIDYCAALPFVLIGLFLGLTLGLLIYRSWWKIAALALLGGALAIVTNCLRIIGIITFDYVTGSKLTLAQHGYVELPALILDFAVLFIVYSRLKAEPATGTVPTRPAIRPGATRRTAGSVVVAAALIAAAPLLSPAGPAYSTAVTGLGPLPATIAGWGRQPAGADWQPRALAKSVDIAQASYAQGGRRIAVFTAQAMSRRAKISGGAIDLIGDEMWMPAFQRPLSACAGTRCYDVRHTRLLLRNSRHVRHLYAVYAIGADTTDSAFAFRLRRAWAAFTGTSASARLIAIATDAARGLASADIAALIQGLTSGGRSH